MASGRAPEEEARTTPSSSSSSLFQRRLFPLFPNRDCDCYSASRGCNAPTPYSSLTVSDSDTADVDYSVSNHFDSALRAAVATGVDAVRRWLGTAEHVVVFLLEPHGPDDAYDGVARDLCAVYDTDDCTLLRGRCREARNVIDTAQGDGGQYYVSSIDDCACGGHTVTATPVFLLPDAGASVRGMTERAIHEYTHTIQAATGGPVPAWAREGGAVYNECFFAETTGTYASFSQCMEFGGGGGGVLRRALELYADNDVRWFTVYAADRACGEDRPPSGSLAPDFDRQVYYDLGAVATAFAIRRSGRTSVDFWRGDDGFWRSTNIPYEIDRVTGWPSSVPEGRGWKKILTDFTGDATYAAFQAAFEVVMRPNGFDVATLDELKDAVLGETDAAILTMSESSSSGTFGPNDKCSATRLRR